MKLKRVLHNNLPAVILSAALLLLWQLYTVVGSVESYLLPSPLAITEAFINDYQLLLDQFLNTSTKAVLGLLTAAIFGTLFALLAHRYSHIKQASYPLLIASQAVPIVLIAPVLIAWLGFGLIPKLIIITLICFFPITVSLLDGLGRVPSEQIDLFENIGASRWQRIKLLEIPSALPSLFSGLKVSAAVAVIGTVFAEQASPTAGLGRLIVQSLPQLETARAFAAVLLLCLLSVALFVLTALLERRLTAWNFEKDSNSSYPQ